MLKHYIKTALTIVALYWSVFSYSQSNQYFVFVEYSPSMTEISNRRHFNLKLSHLAKLRLEKRVTSNMRPSISLGILNTGEQFKGNPEWGKSVHVSSYNYLLTTFGLRLNWGSFFILPELGLGLNLSKKIKSTYSFDDVDQFVTENDISFGQFNKYTVPFFFNIGKEVETEWKPIGISLQMYYALNSVSEDRDRRHYGLGLNVSVKL